MAAESNGLKHLRELRPDPANRRKHNPRNIGMVVDALQAVGAARSIVIDEDDIVLAGNGVVEAAAEAGITAVRVVEATGSEVVAVRRSGLSDEQKRALAMYDNRTGELAEWDAEQLALDQAAGLDLRPWFSEKELAEVVGAATKAGRADQDTVPDVRATDIQPGDLFELGPHRLLCGDSTQPDDVARLMGDAQAGIMVTDPPYAIYGSSTGIGTDIADDKMVRPFFLEILRLAAARVSVFGHIYICCDWRSWPSWWEMAKRAAVTPKNLIVWDKGGSGLGSSYANTYELVGFFAILPKQTVMTSGQKSGQRQVHTSNVWRGDRVTGKEREHNAQKPVGLMEFLIVNSSDEGDTVLEPFSGSGTTMIAAENTKRACLSVEIDPRYVQMTIDRWEAFSGQKAMKVGEAVRS